MLVIIPARGGSKGLPKKNILPFSSKPLIVHSIETALNANYVSRVVVSTDCEEIAQIAKKAGAEIPFFRPPDLATDSSQAIDVYLYTVDRIIQDSGLPVDSFCVLLPTSPLRLAEDVEKCISLFMAKNAHSVISMSKMHPPPEWAKSINSLGLIHDGPSIANNQDQINRQFIAEAYAPNGSVYVFNSEKLKTTRRYYSHDSTYAYIMPKERSIDIDDITDFKIAEFLFNLRGK